APVVASYMGTKYMTRRALNRLALPASRADVRISHWRLPQVKTFIAICATFVSTAAAAVALTARQTPPVMPASNEAPEITFEKETHDFGTIPQGTPVSYMFVVKNTGKAPLFLTGVNSACGCLVADWSREPIKPGKSGFVKGTFNAAAPGDFTKSLTVTSNAKK